MIIAERLKEARKKSGINQKSLAEMVGVYTKDISRWETGVRTPSAEYSFVKHWIFQQIIYLD